MPGHYRRLVVILVRTSKYDDEGYVVRHWRGTLPSNTLSCLHSLTEDVVRSGELGAVEVRVEVIDEIVSRVDPAALGRRHRREGTKVVVGLVGVQTNQFPRAQDLARQFKAQGFDVIIGGFHVSGAVVLSSTMPPECQAMLDAGVTLVLGEVEGRWGAVLRDVLAGRLQPAYDYLAMPPDLADMPPPWAARATQQRFVMTHGGTINAGRGCPLSCSFCTIINVQGRRMRSRRAAAVLDQIRENYWLNGRAGVRHYFFTDDNFARHPQWEAIFDGPIRLRDAEGPHVDFMMQVDVQAPRVQRFVDKAARAGCVQVFIGMESVRDDNLHAGGKSQDRAADYRDMIACWREVGVVCHVGYIIGLPCDTYERVMEDVRTLRDTLHVDQASLFMLAPLPGSRDHQTAVRAGLALDPDYNNYDSCHAAVAVRLASMQVHLGVGARILGATLTERLDATRDVMGSREAIATGLTASRADETAATIDAVGSGTGRVDDGRCVQAALADLRLPELPAVPSPSWWRRQLTRLNPFSLDRLDYDPAGVECRRRTRRAAARLERWRMNPLMLAWNLVRAIRQSLVFLVAMHGER